MKKIKIITEQNNYSEVTLDVSSYDILSMKKQHVIEMDGVYEICDDDYSVEEYIEAITIGGEAYTEEEQEIFDMWDEEYRSEFPNQAIDTKVLIDKEIKEDKTLEEEIEQQNELISILWDYISDRDVDNVSRRLRELESEKNNK